MQSPKKVKTRIIHKHATAAVWKSVAGKDFKPLQAELIVYDPDQEHAHSRLKIGDGKSTVQQLPFISAENADTAEKLSTARKIQLTGDVSGQVSFDGSENVAIATSFTGTMQATYTPSGTVSTPTLVGSVQDKVLSMSISTPTFTGTEATITSSKSN